MMTRNFIAIIRGDNLDSREIHFYAGLKNFSIRFIGTYTEEDIKYINAINKNKKIIFIKPEYTINVINKFLSKFVGQKFSPISLVYIQNLDKHIANCSIINVAEIYSNFSYQCALMKNKHKNIKLIITVWETIPNHPTRFIPMYKRNINYVIKYADLFLAMTKKAKEYLLSHNIPREKIYVLYPGIDVLLFKRRNDMNIRNSTKRILFVGRLSEEKGVIDLIKAFKILYNEYNIKNVELWICGDGPLKNFVINYSNKLPIKYYGYVSRYRLPELYSRCNIFCAPSKDRKKFGIKIWEEQFGFVFLEAMASGLPIVTTNCGAIPEIVGDKNLIVKQGNIKQLADALYLLLIDYKKAIKLSRENINRVYKKFNISIQTEKLEKIINNLF